MTEESIDEVGRTSKSKLKTVLGPTPNAWAAQSDGLAAFLRAAESLGEEGDPRAVAMRFIGVVAATHAASAETNAEVFEATARILHRVAADLKRFGWVKGASSTEPANDNVRFGPKQTLPLLLQIATAEEPASGD